MFSNIGEWVFELYIEIQSCSRVKGGGGNRVHIEDSIRIEDNDFG